ncbi:hypothetical protein EDB83DRAFT_2368945 [Lactarius deliciosus]|nr:hypothetical protein EDB83DRAFT_2368945 [Lactarius deliciosus]
MVLIGYRFWKSIHWISKASDITTTFLFGLSSLNSAAIFATGLGAIEDGFFRAESRGADREVCVVLFLVTKLMTCFTQAGFLFEAGGY